MSQSKFKVGDMVKIRQLSELGPEWKYYNSNHSEVPSGEDWYRIYTDDHHCYIISNMLEFIGGTYVISEFRDGNYGLDGLLWAWPEEMLISIREISGLENRINKQPTFDEMLDQI